MVFSDPKQKYREQQECKEIQKQKQKQRQQQKQKTWQVEFKAERIAGHSREPLRSELCLKSGCNDFGCELYLVLLLFIEKETEAEAISEAEAEASADAETAVAGARIFGSDAFPLRLHINFISISFPSGFTYNL